MVSVFKQHGYDVPNADVLRKKWYNVYQRYKTIKGGKRQSGAGSVNWEFLKLMDDRLAKDPTVTPVATLTTRPFERRPLCPADPLLNTTNGGAPPSSSQTSSGGSSSRVSPSPASTSSSRVPFRRRNAATQEENLELKRALLNDIKDRQVYREEKLQVLNPRTPGGFGRTPTPGGGGLISAPLRSQKLRRLEKNGKRRLVDWEKHYKKTFG